jgi:hypothetical protein
MNPFHYDFLTKQMQTTIFFYQLFLTNQTPSLPIQTAKTIKAVFSLARLTATERMGIILE